MDLIRDPYSDAASGGLRLTGLVTMDVSISRAEQLQAGDIQELFAGLKRQAKEYFESDAHMAEADISFDSRIDLRYLGQEHSVTVPVAASFAVTVTVEISSSPAWARTPFSAVNSAVSLPNG